MKDGHLPEIVEYDEWLEARKELLVKEKEFTKERGRLNSERRRLPMVEIDKDYIFEGREGKVGLIDLFDGRSQLIVGHFIFRPDWEKGCPSCSAGADEFSDNHLKNLHARDTSFVYVSSAPLPKLEAYKAEKGWTYIFKAEHTIIKNGNDYSGEGHRSDDGVTGCFIEGRNQELEISSVYSGVT